MCPSIVHILSSPCSSAQGGESTPPPRFAGRSRGPNVSPGLGHLCGRVRPSSRPLGSGGYRVQSVRPAPAVSLRGASINLGTPPYRGPYLPSLKRRT